MAALRPEPRTFRPEEVMAGCVDLARLCGLDRLRERPHGEWIRRMVLGEGDLTLLAHRGSYKTTCLTVAIALTLCLSPGTDILFLRKTGRDAEEVIRQVRRLLECPVLQAVTAGLYGGEPLRLTRATALELTCDSRLGVRGMVQLHGQGIRGALTGRHADLVFADDIVTVRDRESPAERAFTRQVWQELQNVCNPGGRLIVTGTPWHPEDAYSLMPAPLRFDCRATGLLSPAELDALRAGMEPSLFAANYELRHIARQDALFPEPPRVCEDASLLRDGLAHLDASYGGGDCTALTCGVRRGDRVVLYGRLWNAHVDTVLDEVQRECGRLLCAPLLLETNGDRGYLARELRRRGMAVRPYQERMNKHTKISTYLRKWWPRVEVLRGTDPAWLSQVHDYSPTAVHDDAPDSAASLLRALDARGGLRDFSAEEASGPGRGSLLW